MKAGILFTALFLLALADSALAQIAGKVEVTVTYHRQSDRGSNQYAVWMEDSAGKLVKTLYVTRFTADGGYVSRPGCTPLWVEKADAKNLSKIQADAFSGATPSTGTYTYTWDLTDENGNPVGQGVYTLYVQGTYAYPDHQVLFKGNVELGGSEASSITAAAEYTSDEQQNRNMITQVTAKYTNH